MFQQYIALNNMSDSIKNYLIDKVGPTYLWLKNFRFMSRLKTKMLLNSNSPQMKSGDSKKLSINATALKCHISKL